MHMEEIIIFPYLIPLWTFSKAQLKCHFQRPSQTNLGSNPHSITYLLCDIEQVA